MMRGLALGATALLTLGLMLIALGGEGLALLNACLADPSCIASSSTGSMDGFLVVVLAGILLSVVGLVALTIGHSDNSIPPSNRSGRTGRGRASLSCCPMWLESGQRPTNSDLPANW